VRDAVETVLRLLPDTEPMSFRALVAGVPHRLELVVRFLAVLELYKQGAVDLVQFTSFGDLVVRRLAPGEAVFDAAAIDLDEWDEAPGDEPVDDDGVKAGRRE
jgi:segregation and condensation protein A